jgi:Divergent InlB B-repeat domain
LQLRTPLGDIQITMSFFVSGGSTGFAAPMLSYVHGGSTQKTDLTSIATIYYMDPGTSWTITANLTTSTERWQTTQLISGTASSFQTVQFTYYHQYHVSFDFAVTGGGSGYSSPSVLFAQFGAQKTAATKSPVWADAGSNYSYPNSLIGSTASERWEAQSFAGLVAAAGIIEATYFHQYGLVMSYAVTGGGSPGSPSLVAKQFAQKLVAALGPSPSTYFLDAGSVWTTSNSIQGSSANERWEADVPTNGSLTSALTVALNFHHQYMVITGFGPASGGSIDNLTGWQDQGATLQLSATPNLGWKFEGWNGSGTGSYTGRSSTTLFTIGSPIQENATFYPGLSMVAGNNGQISYSFGSTSGTVQAGTAATVFVSAGTVVAIGATPSSLLYSFSRWSNGSGGTGSATSFTLTSPATIQASFSANIPVVGGTAGAVLVVVLVSAFVMRSRRPPTKWDQVSNPKNHSP